MTDKRGKKKCRTGIAMLALFAAVCLTACQGLSWQEGEPKAPSPSPEKTDTGFVLTGPDSYDSADTAILVDRDRQGGTLTFLNLELGRRYTLSVDGTTGFYDKYRESISLSQVDIGAIVDVTFLKAKKHLTTLQLSPDAWSYEGVENYEFNAVRGEVSIGSEVFKLSSNTQYLSQGKSIDSMDMNEADVLTFQGLGSQVLTVKVEKGHGYLRLVNDENFVGGWIEIGQTLIRRITEDMLLLVPEGSYEVSVSNKGGGGVKSVIINRNEETSLDIGDLEIPEPQYGTVLFSTDPSATEIYIDGTKADTSGPVELLFGIHQMIARAAGYQSITQYIRVAQDTMAINVSLEPNRDTEESSSPASSSSPATTTDYYKVYVDAPEGAEVYLDGNYVGISPCSFRKTAGTHVIILRKSGYETRSYSVQIDSEEKDLSYSFADLVRSGTVSNNSP